MIPLTEENTIIDPSEFIKQAKHARRKVGIGYGETEVLVRQRLFDISINWKSLRKNSILE